MKIKSIGSNMTEMQRDDGTVVLFSYETPVAAEFDYKLYKTNVKFSATTTRHINKWLAGRDALPAYQSFFENLVEG